MKKTTSDRKWIAFILLLLAAEVLWLFVDLQWINLPFFLRKSQQSAEKEAGYIVTAKKDLKRRGANSLIWEDSQTKDILFYHDSILTLSQSAAKLYLKDQTDLELSENTLVTLEEPEDKSRSEIRLRFSRGDLRARNPSFKTSVVGDEWIVNLEKGSDVVLRKDKDSYEFEVVSGVATLQTKNGEENLAQDRIVKLGSDQKIESVKKNADLKWKDRKPLRVYTLGEVSDVSLAWEGQTQEVIVNQSGQNEKQYAVGSSESEKKIVLNPGSYKVRLKNNEGLSDARIVEVWKAPHIFLKKPLPRNRLPTGEDHEFVWSSEKDIKNYQIDFISDNKFLRTEKVEGNYKILRFNDESDVLWQVKGIDDEGFLIPALYQNEIYLRHEPLQAPKLKAPQIKKQKPSTGASYKSKWHLLWDIIFPVAQAKNESYEINFEWEAVPGANLYILEVSATPDFRKPELVKTLTKTSYQWKNVKYKKYYWRVASGSAKGRMGLFSEPSELQLEEIQVSSVEKSDPVQPSLAVSLPSSSPTTTIPDSPVETEPLKKSGWGIALAPSYKTGKIKGSEQTTMNLQGMVPLGLQLQYRSDWFDQHNYYLSLYVNQQSWKPKSDVEIPQQKNLKMRESLVTFDRGSLNSGLRWGLMFHESFVPERETAESIKTKQTYLFGLRTSYIFSFSQDWESSVALNLGTDGKLNEILGSALLKKYLSTSEKQWRWSVGAEALTTGAQNQIILHFGMDQF